MPRWRKSSAGGWRVRAREPFRPAPAAAGDAGGLGGRPRAAARASGRLAARAWFVDRFVAALADGTAWERWYFFPFRSLRDVLLSVAIRTVLVDNRQALPAILATLERNGQLDRVCRAMGPRELAALWAQ